MKNRLDKIRPFLISLTLKFKRKLKSLSAEAQKKAAESAPRAKAKVDRFALISWVVTVLLVIALLGSALLWKNASASKGPLIQATPLPDSNQPQVPLPDSGSGTNGMDSIHRELQLKTRIPERPRYEPVTYHVRRGDAMIAIAEEYKVKTETILYVNKTVLDDNPHSLRPGMELLIPPVDGLYYEWKEGDTIEVVAEEFDADPEDIINFPGNEIDLTDPTIKPGTTVMIPGGSRELRDWTQDLVTAGRSNDGSTGTSDFGTNICGGGPIASGFGWPAASHNISGNGYGPGHLGLDIQANEGEAVYAAGSGVVTMAQGGYNYGYGNVVQIDHGSGYVTVYAHLSQINVGVCTPVGQGTLIGLAGSTGNAFGAHLHFEVRLGGSNINPYDIVQ
jgi:murein DD-endopeptidase MepM/ murein hydrolase activator NlpD